MAAGFLEVGPGLLQLRLFLFVGEFHQYRAGLDVIAILKVDPPHCVGQVGRQGHGLARQRRTQRLHGLGHGAPLDRLRHHRHGRAHGPLRCPARPCSLLLPGQPPGPRAEGDAEDSNDQYLFHGGLNVRICSRLNIIPQAAACFPRNIRPARHRWTRSAGCPWQDQPAHQRPEPGHGRWSVTGAAAMGKVPPGIAQGLEEVEIRLGCALRPPAEGTMTHPETPSGRAGGSRRRPLGPGSQRPARDNYLLRPK